MGRMTQAVQRARQTGVVTGFGSFPGIPDDVAVPAAEPFPDEFDQRRSAPDPPALSKTKTLFYFVDRAVAVPSAWPPPTRAVQEPAALDALKLNLKIDAPAPSDDTEIKQIFFNTYFEKVWSGR